jgi:hypothetical protein
MCDLSRAMWWLCGKRKVEVTLWKEGVSTPKPLPRQGIGYFTKCERTIADYPCARVDTVANVCIQPGPVTICWLPCSSATPRSASFMPCLCRTPIRAPSIPAERCCPMASGLSIHHARLATLDSAGVAWPHFACASNSSSTKAGGQVIDSDYLIDT